MPQFDEEKQNKKIEELRLKEEEDVAKILSQKYGILYIDLTTVSIDTDALLLTPEETAKKAMIAPFHVVGKKLFVAVHSPRNEETEFVLRELEKHGYTLILYMASMASLNHAWARYKEASMARGEKGGVLEISNSDIVYFIEQLKNIDDLKAFIDSVVQNQERSHQISRILEVILAGAINTNASDIHIEPTAVNGRLRLRLDGVLQDVTFIDLKTFKLVLSRVKLVSGMKLNVSSIAQDGRFSVVLKDVEVEIRSSVLPGTYGESIVLRILNPNIINIPYSALGIVDDFRVIIERELSKPNGMILTTGPTGSGKTTTLYAFLRQVYTPGLKVITIENPIEYHLEGIVQTQTDAKKGYTFVEGLKSSLRQDPDVIMIGEIRDNETATTAIDAALTGHLVFSTLHTNNAAGVFPRLIGLGVNPKIIGGAINIALAQRLVRVLCGHCKKESEQSTEEKKTIDDILNGMVAKKVQNTGKIWHPVGCSYCNNTGYKGQIGIYEGIVMDKTIEGLLDTNPSDREVKAAARPQGIPDMREDGTMKVLNGTTSLEELYRVVDMTGER